MSDSLIFKFTITTRWNSRYVIAGRTYIIDRSMLAYALKIYECVSVNEIRHSLHTTRKGKESEERMINYAERELAVGTRKLVEDECLGVLTIEYLIARQWVPLDA